MSTPTASEVNKRIAEFCGWTRIRPVRDDETVPIEETSGWFGVRPCGTMQGFVPDYMHAANAAIAAAEKLADDRGWKFAASVLGAEWEVMFQLGDSDRDMTKRHYASSFSEAASLALFAVLGEGG